MVRAGSIGRDAQEPREQTETPAEEARGLGLRPIYEEITASWFQAERTNPQAMDAHRTSAEPSSEAGIQP